jgi:hypothetical protein
MAFDKTPNSPDFVAMVKEIRDYVVDLAHGGEDYTLCRHARLSELRNRSGLPHIGRPG